MKTAFKFLVIIVIVLLILAGGFFTFISLRGIPTYEVEKIEYEVKSTRAVVERGRKLSMMLCANCHRDPETRKLTGKWMADAPPEFGKIYAPNITNDLEYGIGDWTDGEIKYLLRTGIKRDGQYAPPYMAKLPKMADSDINAIIAFLRSDDPMVNDGHVTDQSSEPSFLTKMLCQFAFKPLPLPDKKITLPDPQDTLALGKYLAHNLECFSCHSADFKTNNFLEPSESEGYFGGGNRPLNREGEVILTSNLTPHETGIGNWTEAAFIKAVKYGLKEGEPALRYPMLPYTQLTDAEVSAIYKYLQTIPPIDNKLVRSNLEK